MNVYIDYATINSMIVTKLDAKLLKKLYFKVKNGNKQLTEEEVHKAVLLELTKLSLLRKKGVRKEKPGRLESGIKKEITLTIT